MMKFQYSNSFHILAKCNDCGDDDSSDNDEENNNGTFSNKVF